MLSTLILQPERFGEVARLLGPRDFYFDAHRLVFLAIERLLGDGHGVDTVTLARNLKDAGDLDKVGGTPYLSELTDATPSVANVVDHARTVKRFSDRRSIARIAQQIVLKAQQGGEMDDLRLSIAQLAQTTEPTLRLRMTTLEEAIQGEDEPIDWVWSERHLVAPGRPTIIGAYGGTGKTWLVLVMALSVATGLPFFGFPPARTGKAIVLEYETGSRRLRRRLRRLVHGYSLASGLENLAFAAQEDLGVWLTSPGAEEELVRLCANAVLLIVDSLIQASPGLKENDAEMAGPLHLLSRVSSRTGCAVCVIHHERKTHDANAGSSAGQSLRGHSALQAAADAVWRLARSGDMVTMRPTKVSDGRSPDGWDFRIVDTDGGGIVIEASDALDERTVAAPLGDRLRELITSKPGMSGRELRVAVGGRRDAVYDALTRLQIDGAVSSRPGPHNSTTWWPVEGDGS